MGNFKITPGKAVRFAAWIADINSITKRGYGARVDLAADWAGEASIPSGTAVEVVTRGGVDFITPADGTGQAFLTYNDVIGGDVVGETDGVTGSSDTVSLVTGGDVYENKLPDTTAGVLDAGVKTALGARFGFQNGNF